VSQRQAILDAQREGLRLLARLLESVAPDKPDLDAMADEVIRWLKSAHETTGENFKPPEKAEVVRHLKAVLDAGGGGLAEATAPNKSGHGCHDTDTGHPAPCPGSGAKPGLARRAAGAVAGKVSNTARAVASAPGQVSAVFAAKYADAAGGKASRILKASGGTLSAGVKAAASSAGQKAVTAYKGLEGKYGRKGAIAILVATAVLTPLPVPGTMYAPLLVAKGIMAVKGYLKGGEKPRD
jgi:hypothetical protein